MFSTSLVFLSVDRLEIHLSVTKHACLTLFNELKLLTLFFFYFRRCFLSDIKGSGKETLGHKLLIPHNLGFVYL